MVDHTMTKGMAATERTVEDALAHAAHLADTSDIYMYPDGQSGYVDTDLVLLAEEVRRLRKQNTELIDDYLNNI